MTSTTTTTRLGQTVTYTDHQGRQKAAMVVGTPDSVSEGHSIPSLAEGEVHLMVFSPSGRRYTRHNVSEVSEDNPSGFTA